MKKNNNSRTINVKRNFSVGVLLQVILFLFTFATRTVFVKLLSESYLGVNGLFSNILSIFSLADLGLNTVLLFELYKPLASGDTDKLKSILLFAKKTYQIIALFIFAIGILFVPFLKFIVNDNALSIDELKNYYLLYLLNVVFSYLVVYKTTLIRADQKVRVIKIFDTSFSIALQVTQMIVLFFTKNFRLYLIVMVGFTILKNIVLSLVADRIYPFLCDKKNFPLETNEKKLIIDNVKSTFLYRVSATIMNSTDNILISVILGTVVVGYYSNYLLITNAIMLFITILSESIIPSLGNFNVGVDSNKKMEMFKTLLLIFYFIGAFCSSCFMSVFNDFIYLWIGSESPNFILSNLDVAAISFNFFVSCILTPVWMFRETTGQFKQVKYVMSLAAIINIALSIILGKILGLSGIVAATALSKIATLFWIEPKILCKNVFNCSQKEYWFKVFGLFGVSVVSFLLSVFICNFIQTSWILIFAKIGICGIINVCLYCAFYFRSNEFKKIRSLFQIRGLNK